MGRERGAYRLGDVDVDHRRGAEGRRASIPGLDDQRPLAVLLLGDVVHNLHGLDVRLEPDLSGVRADFEGVVRVGRHDGVFDDVVWRFGIFVQCLRGKKKKRPKDKVESFKCHVYTGRAVKESTVFNGYKRD